jgi:hypothetical protein
MALLPFAPGTYAPNQPGPVPSNCADFYFDTVIARDAAAYDTTQLFHIEATADGLGTVSTPTPRELYVEHLISQNRNQVLTFEGESNVVVGQTYNYTVTASTATNGYKQIVTSVDFPHLIFQIVSVSVDYTAPPGAQNNSVYGDACGWDPVPGPTPPQGTYMSCLDTDPYPGGKAGGDVTIYYTVRILSAGTATLSPIIYDFSDSSYHYNSDYGLDILTVTAEYPLAVDLAAFSAVPQGNGVLLSWQTATELDNLGFNVYRADSPQGQRTRLNKRLIPSQMSGSVMGASYSFLDETAVPSRTYYYWLEDVDVHGMTGTHGPAEVRPATPKALPGRPRPAPIGR